MVAQPACSVDPAFWRGRRVLVTGHTGFKGGWLSLWLARLGAKVTGIGLVPQSDPSLFAAADVGGHVYSHIFDIADAARVAGLVRAAAPELVFHLAAQPLVRESYRRPLATFASNFMGTANVLDAMRGSSATRVAVIITTDKVYANREWAYPYREDDTLGGHDPYAASKAACELLVDSYRLSFLADQGVAVASARAGNVIGGGDWSADRLIPDVVRAWTKGEVVRIRRPEAVRPWQHVLEPLNAYIVLAQRLWSNTSLAQAFNIGPANEGRATVREVVSLAREAFGRGDISFEPEAEGPHESGMLTLETAKARELLGIAPKWALDQAVGRSMAWYAAFAEGQPAEALCAADIEAFEMAT